LQASFDDGSVVAASRSQFFRAEESRMERESLDRRVDILEQHVEMLKDLPARMTLFEAQILQLRSDMNGGFSALSYAVNALHGDMVARLDTHDQKFDDLRRDMHLLHEDVLERIARLGER
jgi:hypothetical protein